VPIITGLIYINIPCDGHCLFHAVGLYLGETQDQIRKEVADYLRYHVADLREIIQAVNPRSSAERYIEDVRRGVEWGDNLEIMVLMKVLNRPIFVIGPDGRLRERVDTTVYTGEPIFIYYNGHNHYDAYVLDGTKTGIELYRELLRRSMLAASSSSGGAGRTTEARGGVGVSTKSGARRATAGAGAGAAGGGDGSGSDGSDEEFAFRGAGARAGVGRRATGSDLRTEDSGVDDGSISSLTVDSGGDEFDDAARARPCKAAAGGDGSGSDDDFTPRGAGAGSAYARSQRAINIAESNSSAGTTICGTNIFPKSLNTAKLAPMPRSEGKRMTL